MNICIIYSTPFPPGEGLGFYVWNLAKCLNSQGHKVHIITRGNWRSIPKEIINNITIWKPRFFPLYPFHANIHSFFVNPLLKILDPQPDIIHIQSPLVNKPITIKPILVTVHTPMKVDTQQNPQISFRTLLDKLQSPFSVKIEQDLFQRANQLVGVSRSVANELEQYGISSSKVKVFGVGVDTSLFFPLKDAINKKDPYILTVGRLVPRKGFEDLIQCAELVVKQIPTLKFLIAGSGPMETNLIRSIENKGLQGKVVLLGHIGNRVEMVDLYRGATAYLHPAHYEGLPAVMLEAMACAKPVIVTAVSGALEVIRNEINGLLVPPRDIHSMANALLRVLKDYEFAHHLGTSAFKTIQDEFTWTAVSQRYLDEYQRLVHEVPD